MLTHEKPPRIIPDLVDRKTGHAHLLRSGSYRVASGDAMRRLDCGTGTRHIPHMESQFIAGVGMAPVRNAGLPMMRPLRRWMRGFFRDPRGDARGSWCGCSNIRPLYTAGTSADPPNCSAPIDFQCTRQGVAGAIPITAPDNASAMFSSILKKRGRDVRCYVSGLERWLINALAEVGVAARQNRDASASGPETALMKLKIGAIGVRIRRWVTLHGFAINVDPRPVPFCRNHSLRYRRLWRYQSEKTGHPGCRWSSGTRLFAGSFPQFLEEISQTGGFLCEASAL